ncbi:Fc.00g106330.m01.CDS01 [Cosmosporella sp. VM-42]
MKLTNGVASRTTVILLSVAGLVQGDMSSGRPGYGLIGYGIKMYDPTCAFACQGAVPTTLDCPDAPEMEGMEGMAMGASPECLTTNKPYLQSLAWCIYTHCDSSVANIPKLEKFWVMNVAGRQVHQPIPNISYETALEQVRTPPTEVLGEDEILNRTVKVDDDSYLANYNIYTVFEEVEINHSTYSIVVFTTGAVIPIGLSLLRLLPLPARLVTKFNAFFIDPPVFGSRHETPLFNLAIVPTRGQALFIAYIVAINIIVCGVGIRAVMPQTWYSTAWYQVAAYVANRTGAISFANIPLLILYSGRNNILLWLTSWSRTTFLSIHRWVAWICTLQACIHSALYLGLYIWQHTHNETAKQPFWYWGIIATLALSLLLPLSILPIRKMFYEFFLIAHIALAIMAIVGSWYHIIYRYDHQWGYETWLYVAVAVWAFDRLARTARMIGKGVHRGYVSRIDEDYLRIDIPGIKCHGHVYAYFPTLSWRFWENHPFSVVNSVGQNPQPHEPTDNTNAGTLPKSGISAATKELGGTPTPAETASLSTGPTIATSGVSLFVRTHNGLTSLLASKIGLVAGIPVLLDGSYGHESSALFKTSTAPTPEFPNTVCIAGGVGITAVLSALASTLSLYPPVGTTKLFWGVRQPGLVNAIEGLVDKVRRSDKIGVSWWGYIEAHITIGDKMNLREILEREVTKDKGTTVIVCGPDGMADDVRSIVTGLGRNGGMVRFVAESFTW